MQSRHTKQLAAFLAVGACALPLVAMAQSIGYGNVSGGSGSGGSARGDDVSAGDSSAASERGERAGRGGRNSGSRGVRVTPYIEAAQIVTAELSPGDDTLTYSMVAAGVDASIQGRNNGASVSLRYEHRFGWGRARDNSTISGVANGYTTIAPGLTLHAGGLAARTRIDNDGGAVLSPLDVGNDSVSQIYSVYAGPSLATHAGPVAVNANYRIGYSKVEAPDAYVAAPGQPAVDVFDDSVVQYADVKAGVKPGQVLPVGLSAGASYYREDVSNLDQRIENFAARADVTVPITNTLQVVGGIGYEDVEISGRDAVRDSAGDPVIGPDGRYVTDKSGPRLIGYDVSGLIWDAGVIWRPSRRTALEAHVGRRYGSTTYYGTFAYAPNPRQALNVSVYDSISGFGGQVSRALDGLPTDFEVVRNPLTGGFGGCVSSLQGGNCLGGSLGSVRSSAFRARGIMASYSVNFGRTSAGVGAGYDRRRFIGAPGTVLAQQSGTIDENYWLAGFLSRRLDADSGIRGEVRANWFQSGSSTAGDGTVLGATASYYRNLTQRLSATAAVGIDGVDRDAPLPDQWIASALLGLRYNF